MLVALGAVGAMDCRAPRCCGSLQIGELAEPTATRQCENLLLLTLAAPAPAAVALALAVAVRHAERAAAALARLALLALLRLACCGTLRCRAARGQWYLRLTTVTAVIC